jgi:hypothetical protein
MNNKKTKGLRIGLIGALALIFVFAAFSIPGVFAFTGSKGAMSVETLFNETNTYHVSSIELSNAAKYDSVSDERQKRVVSYDMGNRVDTPIMGEPQITVLTHGLGSNADTEQSFLVGSSQRSEK